MRHITSLRFSSCFAAVARRLLLSGGVITMALVNGPAMAVQTGINTPDATTPLYMGTNNNVYMTIGTNGYVGIGTQSPFATLEIYDPWNTDSNINVVTPGTQGEQQASIDFVTKDNGTWLGASSGNRGWSTFARGNAYTDVPGMQNYYGNAYWDGSLWHYGFVISPAGNVLIGTTSLLQSSDTLTVYNPAGPHTYLRIRAPFGNQSSLAFNDDTNGQDIVIYRPSNSQDLHFWTAGASDVMVLTQSGSLGIGVATPYAYSRMDVEPTSSIWAAMFNYNGGSPASPYGIWVGGSSYGVYSAGPVYGSAFYHTSDARLKTNIHPIQDALNKLLALQGIEFDWKSNGKHDMGVTAQNVSETFPNIVSKTPEGDMAVEYDSLVGPVIEAIRELKTDNDNLRAEDKELRRLLDDDHREIAELKTKLHSQ